MRKAEREKKMHLIAEELMRQNRILYVAKDNATRMRAAQRAYLNLGLLIGFAGGDYFDPEIAELRAKQQELFGSWAVTNPTSSFGLVDEKELVKIAEENEKELAGKENG